MQTEELYARNAGAWSRTRPTSISDFTGRPAVYELCGEVKDARVVDLGCGEGYCTREMARRGARETLGIDLSARMIELAREHEAREPLGIRYREGNVVGLDLDSESVDLVLAVFVFSYMTCEEMARSFREVRRVLDDGGRFVFAVPHPCLPFMREQRPPFFFDTRGQGYFSGQDGRFEGRIDCVDGRSLPVGLVHKPLEQYFDALAGAGFERLPIVRELRVQDAHLAEHPDLFRPIADVPLHLAFRVEV